MTGQDMLSINVVAARLGLSVHQLRRWELMFGLNIKRGRGQQRQYRPEDLSVLERIRELVEQGWPTSQIRPQLEAEGLINPRLIGVTPNPDNPEMLTESIIGLRTFTERRFIELSKQIDELRQLLISVTLKQELAQDKSSPWQPMTTTTTELSPGPSPRPMPAQEFTFGPQISIDPPSKINSPISGVPPQSGLNLQLNRTFKEPALAQPVVKNAIIPPPNYGGEKAETAEATEASTSPVYPPLPPNPFKPKPKDQEETVDLESDDIQAQPVSNAFAPAHDTVDAPLKDQPEPVDESLFEQETQALPVSSWQNLSSFSAGSSTSEIAQVPTETTPAQTDADSQLAFQATQIDMPGVPESFSPDLAQEEEAEEENLEQENHLDMPQAMPELAQTTQAPEMPKVHEPMPITPGPQVNFGPNVSAPVPQVAPQRVDDNFGLGEVTDQNYLTVLGRALDLIGWTDEQADSYSLKTFGVPHWDELGRSQAEKLVAHLIALLKEQVG